MRHIILILLCLFVKPAFTYAQQTDTATMPAIVFMVAEPEYQTKETLSAFADRYVLPWSQHSGYEVTFLLPDPDDPNNFPGIELIEDAALLVLSVRRRTLTPRALNIIKSFLASGKPLVALRTSSHAFHLRNKKPPAGYADWPNFDKEILGAQYESHFANDLHPVIKTTSSAASHPIFAGIDAIEYTSGGSLYRSRNLAESTTVLLEGSITDKKNQHTEPVAWTNEPDGQKIFYTSLGHPTDFEQENFQRMLFNAIQWTLSN